MNDAIEFIARNIFWLVMGYFMLFQLLKTTADKLEKSVDDKLDLN